MIAPGIRVVRGPDWIWQNQGKIRTDMLLISQRSVIYMNVRGYFLKYTFYYVVINIYALFIFYFLSARVNKGIKLTVIVILFLGLRRNRIMCLIYFAFSHWMLGIRELIKHMESLVVSYDCNYKYSLQNQ